MRPAPLTQWMLYRPSSATSPPSAKQGRQLAGLQPLFPTLHSSEADLLGTTEFPWAMEAANQDLHSGLTADGPSDSIFTSKGKKVLSAALQGSHRTKKQLMPDWKLPKGGGLIRSLLDTILEQTLKHVDIDYSLLKE